MASVCPDPNRATWSRAPSKPSTTRTARIRFEILVPPVILVRSLRLGNERTRSLAATELTPPPHEGLCDGRKQARGVARVDEQALESVANTRALKLRIDDQVRGHLHVRPRVDKHVTDALRVRNDGHAGMFANEADETFAPARNGQVHRLSLLDEFSDDVPIARR